MNEVFTDGDEGRQSVFVSALSGLQSQGQSVLDDLEQMRLETLIKFEHGLSALNARRQRAFRIPTADLAGRFVASDLLDIDQSLTSATLRADSSAVTLRERGRPAEAVIRATKFSSSAGSIERFGDMYRVVTEGGARPTGTFELEFDSTVNLTLIVFDILSTPSNPTITVRVSENGVRFIEALETARNGYRVNAWIAPQATRYLRIEITPSHPDNIGGDAYSFGLTGFNAFTVDFHLQSELVSRPVILRPQSGTMLFTTDSNARGLAYFLSLDNTSFFGASDGLRIPVPGATQHTSSDLSYLDPSTGQLFWMDAEGEWTGELPEDVYPQSVSVVQILEEGNAAVRLAPDLDPEEASLLSVPCFAIQGGQLFYRPLEPDSVRRFRVSFSAGPAEIVARLRVQLSTRDRSQTPVFKGAQLESVY